MAELNLKFKLGIPLGKGNDGQWQFNWLPDYVSDGYPVAYFFIGNGNLSDKESITNEFEVGDKFRQAATKGELMVSFSDVDFRSKLYAIYSSRQTFLAGMKAELVSSDGISKTVILMMPWAYIKNVHAEEAIVGFSPKFATIDFSSADFRLIFRQAEKLMSGASSAVASAVGSVRF